MLPVRTSKLFATTQDDHKFVSIELYQGDIGDGSEVHDLKRLGQVVLDELPPGPAGSVRIELTLTISVESLVGVTARETQTGREARVSVRPSGGLSQKEIVEIISRRRDEEKDDEPADAGDR
jgi:molecular chaperone DnaK (HSP70)